MKKLIITNSEVPKQQNSGTTDAISDSIIYVVTESVSLINKYHNG
jgi:hypothetical protein